MKKIISAVLVLCLAFGFCVNSIAADPAQDESNDFINKTELSAIKNGYTLSSPDEKQKYITEIFDRFGCNREYVDMLTDDITDMLTGAEEISHTTTALRHEPVNTDIICAKKGDEYSFIGIYDWNKCPVMRRKDTLTIGIGEGVVINDSQTAVMRYENKGAKTDVIYNSEDVAYNGRYSLCSFTINLPNFIDSLSFIVAYRVKTYHNDQTVWTEYFHNILPGISSQYFCQLGIHGFE